VKMLAGVLLLVSVPPLLFLMREAWASRSALGWRAYVGTGCAGLCIALMFLIAAEL
jgi:hypothetical protein